MRKIKTRYVAFVAVLLCVMSGTAVAEERSEILEKICDAAPAFCELWGL
ncbi:hypothetical protein LJR168_002103 [Pseudoxanthomonas sp. LjRoot168]|nr:hypothetical protein [uncultured Pseudoxanthomonas sp.]